MARNPDNAGGSGKVELSVHVQLQEVDDRQAAPQPAVYAYSAGGKLLAMQPADERGQARLALAVGPEDTAVRVLVGPTLERPEASELLRRGAVARPLRLSLKDPRPKLVLTIDPDSWRCWLLGRCVVRGTLLKRVVSGGLPLELPVCHASIDVWEVDPWPVLVPRLPPWVIDGLRRVIVEPRPPWPEPPGPWPIDGPGPLPPPGPGPDPVPLAQRRAMRAGRTPGIGSGAAVLASFHAAPQAGELKTLAQIGNAQQFQQALIRHPELVRPLLCWFYPHIVTKQKVATAVTDECGQFRAVFWRGCQSSDVPDLYFTAQQRLFGWLNVSIYEPTPVPCHTHWNYVCGTPVTLITTSPWAIACSPCRPYHPGDNWVLFTAVGNTSLKAIHGGGAPGATGDNLGLLQSGAPWGGVLRPRLDFDNALRESLGVRYYQLSWRKGMAGDFKPLSVEVNRHYAHMVGTDLVIDPYRLGPNHMVVGDQTLELYEIPPALPPLGQWTIANAVLDTENGEFDSRVFSRGLAFEEDGDVVPGSVDESGLYQIKLDLYDAAGNQIDIAAKGIDYYVPDSVSLSGSIPTVKASSVTLPGGGSLVQGNSLVLTLHVDNNHCWAGVGAPWTPSGTADPCCGVLRFAPGASVSMPYVAYHPHGFATHAFSVVRSATQILSPSGGVGSFVITRTVHDMMTLNLPAACAGKPECTTAAFGERLDVYEMATDGWGSDLGYEASDLRAFALSTQ